MFLYWREKKKEEESRLQGFRQEEKYKRTKHSTVKEIRKISQTEATTQKLPPPAEAYNQQKPHKPEPVKFKPARP